MGSAALGLAAAMPPTGAVAQTAPANEQPATATEQPAASAPAQGSQGVGLEDIIVTAQRRSQAISQVPISVQAISAATLQRTGPVDTTTLITRLSPSVSFRPGVNSGSSSVAIRGVSSVAIEGGIQASTSIVVDGVPLYRQGEFLMDLNDVDSIEVLRGPQGTLFGKNSTAGVISINTQNPQKEFAGRVQAGLTTDEEYFVNGMVNAPLGDSARLRVTGFYRDQNPLVKNLGPARDPFGAQSYGFQGKLAIDLADNIDVLVTGGYSHLESTYGIPVVITPPGAFTVPGVGNFQVLATGIAGGYGNDRVNTNTDTVNYSTSKYIQAQVNWRVNDRTTVTSVTSYRKFDNNYKVDSDVTPFGFDQGVGLTPTPASYPFPGGYPFRATGVRPDRLGAPEHVEYGSQELRLNYEGDRASVVAGVFYQTFHDKASATNPFHFGGLLTGAPPTFFLFSESRYRYSLDNDAASIFGDITYKLSDQFSVFGGLRFTHETLNEKYHRDDYSFQPSSTFDVNTLDPTLPPTTTTDFNVSDRLNNLSGRAGVQFRPNQGMNFYASYNRGYKGPAAFTGRAASNTPPAAAITKPEIAEAFEIGTKQRFFNNRVSAGLSLYTQKIRDIQQTGNVPGTTFITLLNAGDLKSRGAEFELQAQVVRNFRVGGAVSYTHARYAGSGAVVACPDNEYAAGVFSTPACSGATPGIVAGSKSIAGGRAAGSPDWAFNASADYTIPLGDFGEIAANIGYSWQDTIQYSVSQDSRTIDRSHGFLNASLTLVARRGWEVQIYGRNLTNEFYYGTLSTAFPVGDKFGILNRDYKRYGGLSFKYSF